MVIKSNLKTINAVTALIIYEILMISISALIVLLSIWNLFFAFSPDTYTTIQRADYIICGIFAIDLIIHLIFAKDKKKCLKGSILTIFAVLPFATLFRIAGVLRLNNVFLLLRYPTIGVATGFSGLWSFFMTPAVIRISKFFNLARSYFNKHIETNK